MEPSQAPEDRSQIVGCNRCSQMSVSLQETRSWYRYAHTNPLIGCRSASPLPPAPPLSSDAGQLHLTDGNNYSAFFDVKYLGSGLVLHQTDFCGCQALLNERRRKRQRRKCMGIVITPKSLFVVDKLTGVPERELTRDLENVYVLHPHPTKRKLFGIITENNFSGTFYCYCYLTKRGSTGVDVLHAFRKACYLWLSNSNRQPSRPLTQSKRSLTQSNQSLTLASSEFAILDGIPENYIHGEQSGGDLRVRRGSKARCTHNQAKEDSSARGFIHHPSQQECQQEGTEQPYSKCDVEQPVPTASRQVSFAPVAKVNCYQLPGAKCVDIPLEQSISQSPIYAKVTSGFKTQKPQPKRNVPHLPPRNFPPPLPPKPSSTKPPHLAPSPLPVTKPPVLRIKSHPLPSRMPHQPHPRVEPPCPQPPYPPPPPPLPAPVLRSKSHPLPSRKPHPLSPRVEPPCSQPPSPPPPPPLPAIKPPIRSYPLPSRRPHLPSPRVEPIPPPPAHRAGPHAMEPCTKPVGSRVKQPVRMELFTTPTVNPYLSPAQEAPHTPPRAPRVSPSLLSAECTVQSEPEETDSCPPTPPPRTRSLTKSHKLGMLGVY